MKLGGILLKVLLVASFFCLSQAGLSYEERKKQRKESYSSVLSKGNPKQLNRKLQGTGPPAFVDIPQTAIDQILGPQLEAFQGQPKKVGTVVPFPQKLNFHATGPSFTEGNFISEVRPRGSADVARVNLCFSQVYLPEDYELHVIGSDDSVSDNIVSYASDALPDGCLPTVLGSSAYAIVSPVEGAAGSSQNINPADFDVVLSEVGAILADASTPQRSRNLRSEKSSMPDFHLERNLQDTCSTDDEYGCGVFAEDTCFVNAESCTANPATDDAKSAVASYQFRRVFWWFECTGALINNNNSPRRELFLTAEHCVPSGGVASTMEAYFFHRDDSSTCYQAWSRRNYDVRGGSLISAYPHDLSGTDSSLVELNQSPPSECVYMGFNAEDTVNVGDDMFRISHPEGYQQFYTAHTVYDSDAGNVWCSDFPSSRFTYSTDVVGAVRYACSGSPIIDGDGRIRGHLYGHCGFNLDDVCDSENNKSIDGRLANFYADKSVVRDALGNLAIMDSSSTSTTSQPTTDTPITSTPTTSTPITSTPTTSPSTTNTPMTSTPTTSPPACSCSDHNSGKPKLCNDACGGGVCSWDGKNKICQ